MSDQYTRIRYGGSPLDASAPVVGLLFGKQQQQSVEHNHNNNKKNSDGVTTTSTTTTTTTTCYVEDAGDIPLEDAQKQIDLHQAVFPKHQVIGWYKVVLADNGDGGGGDDQTEPTIEDLQQTQQIQSLYQLGVQQKKDDPNAMDDSTSSFSPTNTFFGLLHVPSMKKTSNDKNKKEAMETEGGEGKSEDVGVGEEDDEDDEDELPLTLYRLDQEQGGAAAVSLVALHSWSLHTSESERIAVQRVMREKAVTTTTTTTTTETTTTTTPPTAAAAVMASQKPSVQQQQGGEEATATTSSSAPQLAALSLGAVEPQVIRPYADELQESCVAIAARLSLVLQYLETVQEQQQSSLVSLPRTAAVRQQQQQSLLLRQVQGLLLQLGILSGTVPHPDNYGNRSHAQQLQQVAALAKAVDAVTLFTEKFRFLTEHGGRGGGSSGRGLSSREVRRF